MASEESSIERWIAEGRLIPPEVPGGILDLLPFPPGEEGVTALSDEVISERDRE